MTSVKLDLITYAISACGFVLKQAGTVCIEMILFTVGQRSGRRDATPSQHAPSSIFVRAIVDYSLYSQDDKVVGVGATVM